MLFSFYRELEKLASGVSTSNVGKPIKPIVNTMKPPLTSTPMADQSSFPYTKPTVKGGIRNNSVPTPSIAPINPIK